MKNLKNKLIYALVAALLLLTLYSDYTSAVVFASEDAGEAADDASDDIDVNSDEFTVALIEAAAALGGMAITASTPALLFDAVLGVKSCYDLGYNLGEQLIHNDDGTITIPAGVIQETLDAMNLYDKVKGFSDADVKVWSTSSNVTYYIDYCMHFHNSSNCYDDNIRGSFVSSERMAAYYDGFKGLYWTRNVAFGFDLYGTRSGVVGNVDTYYSYAYGSVLPSSCSYTCEGEAVYPSVSMSMPIFPYYDSYEQYMKYGTGYENALNYHEYIPTISHASSYSPTYSGDDVVVTRDRLVNLPDKYPDSADNPDDTVNYVIKYLTEDEEPEPETSTEPETGDDVVGADLTDTNNWLEKIYKRLGVILDEVKAGFDDVVAQLKALKALTALDVMFNGADAVADWLDFIQNLLDDVGAGVGAMATGLTQVGELAKTKFPFCLPWDIMMVVSLFAADPLPPEYDLTIKIESLGIDDVITIDFSQFQIVSDVTRTMLTVMYILALMNFTNKVILTKKGN